MIIAVIPKRRIVLDVKRSVKKAEREIIATMFLSEELKNPLPEPYHKLLQKKTLEGVFLVRLGFGTKEAYNQINSLYKFSKNYRFLHSTKVKSYQRLILIDRKVLFFGVDKVFFKSKYKPLIEAFLKYFEAIKK